MEASVTCETLQGGFCWRTTRGSIPRPLMNLEERLLTIQLLIRAHVRVDIHLGYPFFHDRIRKYFCRFFFGNALEPYIGTIRIYSCASVNELCPIQLRRSAATAASRAVDAMDCNV